MLFSSLIYILGFLPVVFFLYFACFRKAAYGKKIVLLLAASLFFYGWWLPKYLPLLLGTIVINYLLGKVLRRENHPHGLLPVGIILNLLPLFFFKYIDFVLGNVAVALGWCGVAWAYDPFGFALPLGISFFTFQQLAYLVDCHRGGVRDYGFGEYALFVSFWPQLIAGPIVHHKDLLPQFQRERNAKIHSHHIYWGLVVFLLGLGKKIIVADQLGSVADWGWGAGAANLSTGTAWLVTVSYTFQLYFDFSGYCDMAWGSAMLFNIRLPLNFFSPYKAKSIQDFWRRWHMTLSRWLRDYLYIPFGGSRCSFPKTLRNVVLTFLIGGIWHGAGWTFVLWGLVHGLALAINRVWSKVVRVKLPTAVAWLLTIAVVHFAWVLFRAPDLASAGTMLARMFIPSAGTAAGAWHWAWSDAWLTYVMLAWAIIVAALPNTHQIGVFLVRRFSSNCWQIVAGVISAVILLLCLVRLMDKGLPQSPFLYFQF